MKTKLWKTFLDYEKEEKWLNKMAAKGLAMTAYTFCRYTFEECIPGEYIYRIEYLEHNINHPESVRYVRFLSENGVEHVDTYFRWVYFRKKAAEGDFKIYSDLTSRIKHYQRISQLWLVIGCMNLFLGLLQSRIIIQYLTSGPQYWISNAIIGALSVSLGIILLTFWWYNNKKIKRLKREREIHET
ncbi:MAG: DUF2812 domain-containing protein [Candidatus Bathyarchaeota archaeon]|uniref:DUF2812 domain-containing protein n=1 Tax=Candidatus Bathycorpusculum sp. TaxID=2994959 RepID=UPI00283717F2|nr:DUF2812 domain-containing protein [Candidatus Termiticorpusculum sp.]MCL2256990.1 DUF2812 domain-containing protein [Candidatus Termiticorpusculum sp.]MCL2292886.1 DUF2812 domain-containing protein [Candidatus Termiticorpusculum sp.]